MILWVNTFVVFICLRSVNVLAADLPSFLFLLGDDIGWADFSYNNGTAITPHLDEWARADGSILMNDFHSGGTVCSPTRATILTGRNHFRDCVNGVYGCSDPTECTPNFPFAREDTFTVAHAVRKASSDYTSMHFGKWHLGSFYNDSEKFGGVTSSPLSHGFDRMNSTIEVAPTATTNCQCSPDWLPECDFGHYHKPTHCHGGGWAKGCCFNYWSEDTDAPHGVTNLTFPTIPDDSAYLADSFDGFVKSLNGKPFFAQISFHNCHIPYIGSNASRISCMEGKTCKPGNYTDAQLDFYACLTEFDTSIGKVLKTLEKYEYRKNTMIWFTTDNGPEGNCEPEGVCTEDHFKTYPGTAGPLRGRKRDIWEGGHRVPGIISWPQVVKKNQVSWDMVVTMDFLATVMDVLNVSRPKEQSHWGFDGMSVMPLLEGNPLPERGMGWMFSGYNASKNQHGFRYGKWKYVERTKSCKNPDCKKPLLYDLNTDLGERNDLSAKHPDILKAIMANFTVWYKSVMQSVHNESKCPSQTLGGDNWISMETS